MRVWVVGGGSIGLLYAGRLALRGEDVTLITRTAEQAEAVKASGITITGRDGTVTAVCRAHAIDRFERLLAESGAPDWILLTMKQYGITPDVLRMLGTVCGASSRANVLAMQNGIGHLELLSQAVPKSRLFAAVVSEGAGRTSLVSVDHTGSGITRIGAAEGDDGAGGRGEHALFPLQKVLRDAGFRCVLSKQLKDDIWHKLIINAVINPLTALLEIRNGELLQHDDSLRVMRRLYDEAAAVAARCGVRVDEGLWDMLLDVCRKTASNRSSMWQDLLAGRPTELEWINGAIVRTAETFGLAAPTHELILQLMRTKEEIR